jgi:LPXTG-motif cell wall-anchored protein
MVVCTTSSAWALQGTVGNTATRTGGASGAGGNAPMTNAPEINPALIIGAVVLLVGAILIVSSRRRRAASDTNS